MTVTHELELSEPVINALLKVLELNMPEQLANLNEEYNDGVTLTMPCLLYTSDAADE